MHSFYGYLLLPVLVSLNSHIVLAQQVIAAPNYDKGWCYYCSDDDAPPLCNSQCTTAINTLCAQELTLAQIVTEQNCTVQYRPPVDPNFNRNGAPAPSPSASQCTITFNNVLAMCGRDAGTPQTATADQSYCTASGGGGTYGWNDDGSVMTDGLGRYVVSTTGTDQCGQDKASWHQADSVVLYNDDWVSDSDQVVLDTNPPASLASSAAAVASAMPPPNPECDTEVCDIYDAPYYAVVPVLAWAEGGAGSLRHRILYEGWSVGDEAQRLRNSVEDRCGTPGGNWQGYMNGTQNVADFDLPANLCWCAKDAVFDASVGIVLTDDVFCPADVRVPIAGLVHSIELRDLSKGLKVRDPRRVVRKDPTG